MRSVRDETVNILQEFLRMRQAPFVFLPQEVGGGVRISEDRCPYVLRGGACEKVLQLSGVVLAPNGCGASRASPVL